MSQNFYRYYAGWQNEAPKNPGLDALIYALAENAAI